MTVLTDAEHMERVEDALRKALPHLQRARGNMKSIQDKSDPDTAKIRNGVYQMDSSLRAALSRIESWFEE